MKQAFIDHLPNLLRFTHRVVNALAGGKTQNAIDLTCERLAMKIFLHATSVEYLRNGTKLAFLNTVNPPNLIDFPSILILSRSILETYLNLFEVVFEPNTDDEAEYRHAVYEIEGFSLPLNVLWPEKEVGQVRYVDQQEIHDFNKRTKQLHDLRERIKHTRFYQSLDKNQRNASLEGSICPKRSKPVIAKAAGFSPKYIETVYAYFSSFVHGDALSGAQIIHAALTEQQKEYVEISLTVVELVLAQLISQYAARFPLAKNVYDNSPEDAKLVQILIEVAKNMDD